MSGDRLANYSERVLKSKVLWALVIAGILVVANEATKQGAPTVSEAEMLDSIVARTLVMYTQTAAGTRTAEAAQARATLTGTPTAEMTATRTPDPRPLLAEDPTFIQVEMGPKYGLTVKDFQAQVAASVDAGRTNIVIVYDEQADGKDSTFIPSPLLFGDSDQRSFTVNLTRVPTQDEAQFELAALAIAKLCPDIDACRPMDIYAQDEFEPFISIEG